MTKPIQKTIQLALSASASYSDYLGVVLFSLMENCDPSYNVHAHILHDSREDSSLFTCQQLTTLFPRLSFSFIGIDNSLVSHFQTIDYISSQTYYRALIPELISEQIEKIIYLDCDLLIKGDIAPLWEIDLKDRPMAAVPDSWMSQFQADYIQGLGLQEDSYVNTGVLLLNLAALRKMNFTKQFLDLANEMQDHFRYGDQDIINVLLKNSFLPLSAAYNAYFPQLLEEHIIEHFTGSEKPWHLLSAYPDYLNSLIRYHQLLNLETISLIVPVYNVEDYLVDCLDSLVGQTYTKLDILLINDGSTDKSGNICDEYAKKDSRIKVIHKENAGLADARNVGLDAISSPYVIFLDADDRLDKDHVSHLYQTMIATEADITIAKCVSYREADGQWLFFDYHLAESQTHEILTPESWLERVHHYHVFGLSTAWAKLYKTALFNQPQHPIRFPKGRLHEDEFTIYRAILASRKTVLLNETLYLYRIHEDAVMRSTPSLKHWEDLIASYEQKLLDFHLLQIDTSYLQAGYIQTLHHVKEQLETSQSLATSLYTHILERLAVLDSQPL